MAGFKAPKTIPGASPETQRALTAAFAELERALAENAGQYVDRRNPAVRANPQAGQVIHLGAGRRQALPDPRPYLAKTLTIVVEDAPVTLLGSVNRSSEVVLGARGAFVLVSTGDSWWTVGGEGIGEVGTDGEAGATGPAGLPGLDGSAGTAGPPGMDGEQGPQGDPGPPGQPGQTGLQGYPGVPGADGLDGEPGPPGAKGDKGDRGDPGPPGQDGLDGSQGPPGPKGDKGDKGDRGPPGADGLDGEPGAPGPAGAQGAAGPTPSGDDFTLIGRGDGDYDNTSATLSVLPQFNWSRHRVAHHAEFDGAVAHAIPIEGFTPGGHMKLDGKPAGEADHPGMLRCTVPVGRSGYLHMGNQPDAQVWDPATLLGFRAILNMQTANPGADYTAVFGFGQDISQLTGENTPSAQFGTDGLWIATTSGGVWRRVRRIASASTGNNTAVNHTAGSWFELAVLITGATAELFINGTSALTISVSTLTSLLNFGFGVIDNVGGSTDFVVDIDSFTVYTNQLGSRFTA